MMFDEETERAIDEYVEEESEARREHDLLFWEGCTVVTAPTGAPPEYITVEVDGVNDPNVDWRGVPGGLVIGDKVLVWENPTSHRREIVGGSGATASKPFVHDHSSTVQGGDDLNPETISQRTLIVGVGCPYTTLGAAVAAVPATPCTIKIMGITTVEAGAIAVPVDVAVVGMGEGSVIGMGANTLTMSDDSSLMDVVVTHSGGTAIDCVNADAQLFNVKVIVSNEPAYGVDITGDSAAELYHVIVEFTVSGSTVGFHVAGTATPLLFDCQAVDTTNIGDALQLSNSACTCTTHNCRFAASSNDVWTGAASTWIYCNDDFDYRNCTVNGTASPADGQPVIWFDYTVAAANAAAITAAIEWARGRNLMATYTIDVPAGSYDLAVEFEDTFCASAGRIVLEGDTRVLAGISYVDGAICNPAGLAGGGTFNNANRCTITTNPGLDQITVSGGTVDPDFSNFVNGDTILVFDESAATVVTRTINSINPGGAGNHVIEITVALAAALGGDGDAICLKPNRSITRTVAGTCVTVDAMKGVKMDGWFLDTATGANCHAVMVTGGGRIELENVATDAEDYGFTASAASSWIVANGGAMSVWGSARGYYAAGVGRIDCANSVAVNVPVGYYASAYSYVQAAVSIVTRSISYGYIASQFSMLGAAGATARQCAVGAAATAYMSSTFSFLNASSTNANNNGNDVDYNPAVSCVPGNCESVIQWS